MLGYVLKLAIAYIKSNVLCVQHWLAFMAIKRAQYAENQMSINVG